MGLFNHFSYKDCENMTVVTQGEAAAHKNALEAAANSFDLKWLKEVADTTRFYDVTELANDRLLYLKGKSRRECKQLEKVREQKKSENAKRQADADASGRKAELIEGTPEYWAKQGDYIKCAACGEASIPCLLQLYTRENSNGCKCIEDKLLSFGSTAYPQVQVYISQLLAQFNEYVSSIRSLDFSKDADKRKSAVIEAYSDCLERSIILLGRFSDAGRADYISAFYDYINSNIYSHPESGFSDIFNAVYIRRAAVTAMSYVTEKESRNTAVSFYTKALGDPARFVRWECADVLRKQYQPAQITKFLALQEALTHAALRENNSVGNRITTFNWLLGKSHAK